MKIKYSIVLDFIIGVVILIVIFSIKITDKYWMVVFPLSLLDACIFAKAHYQLSIEEFWMAIIWNVLPERRVQEKRITLHSIDKRLKVLEEQEKNNNDRR